MLKKTLFIAGAVALLAGLVSATSLKSYFKTAWNKGADAVADAESINFKLDRARQMIKDLDPEIRHNMHLIAKEEVNIKQLRDRLETAERKLAKDRRDIERLTSDLKRGDSNYVYVGVSYSQKQVETDLKRRFERFKTEDGTVDRLRQILDARQRGLDAANEKLKEMLAAKEQLAVDVEQMEARLKMVQVAQTTSDMKIDDSQLARTRELLNDIGTRIEVAEKLVNVDDKFTKIPLDEPETKNVLDEVSRYFGEKHPEVENIVNLD